MHLLAYVEAEHIMWTLGTCAPPAHPPNSSAGFSDF